MSDLLISKPPFSSFFVNIKQYRPELESLMTLKFHTLEHIRVCCLLRRNLATPRLRSPSNSHSFFSKMNEAGFIFHHWPKSVNEILLTGKHFDYVIAVCDKEAAERCPLIPGNGVRLRWSFPDPSAASGDESERLRVASEVRDAIRSSIESWLTEV